MSPKYSSNDSTSNKYSENILMAIASGGGHRFWRPSSDIWSPKKSPLLQIGIQKMARKEKMIFGCKYFSSCSQSRQTNDLLWHPFGTTCHRQLVMMMNMVRLAMRMVRMINDHWSSFSMMILQMVIEKGVSIPRGSWPHQQSARIIISSNIATLALFFSY